MTDSIDSDVWDEISASLAVGFENTGMGAGPARYCAEVAAAELHALFAGERLYLPKKRRADREALRREFNGRNVNELADKYGVCRATVYNEIGERLSAVRK